MSLKLYKMGVSSPVRAVQMMLDILKLDIEYEEVDLMAGEHMNPEYLEKNPQHAVPFLEDGDFELADSHAIITYLISKYGADKQEKMYPSDLRLRSTIDQRMYFDASNLYSPFRAISMAIVFGGVTGPTPAHVKDVNDAYDILENYLKKTKFVACDHLTVADVACVATISSLNNTVPIDAKYKKVHAWWNELKKEEWYKKANLPGLNLYDEMMKSYLKKNSESSA